MKGLQSSEKQGFNTPSTAFETPQPNVAKSKRLIKRISLVFLFASCILLVFPGLFWKEFAEVDHTFGRAKQSEISEETSAVHISGFEKCSLNNIRATNFTFLDAAKPISRDEFVDRRDRLARALTADDLDAFVVEPGYTFSYYANVTQQEWEVWEPEERPFLMLIQPDGSGRSRTTFLVPSFEAERARLLGMPFTDREDVTWVTYEEHWNPYATLASSGALLHSNKNGTEEAPVRLVMDEEMRDFIARGLATQTTFAVTGLGGEVERPGLTEDDVARVLDNTLREASLEPFFDIVLFDEDASNPHGGTDGSKVLTNTTMVLIDVGAHLYGYSSDVCRSFFPPFTSTDSSVWDDDIRHKLKVWDIVFEAQTQSLSALTLNHSAADVDLAARGVIEKAGYGDAFTHRVGHGIGIKAHESPYLNKGNVDTPLRAGMTFTSEPGIYLVDLFGVRHEDVLLVKDDGLPDVLSGVRATDAWAP
ncbi:hypothetical protein Q7P37_000053 [Cladosporium fusiforme]